MVNHAPNAQIINIGMILKKIVLVALKIKFIQKSEINASVLSISIEINLVNV